jgi:hypothetical protein
MQKVFLVSAIVLAFASLCFAGSEEPSDPPPPPVRGVFHFEPEYVTGAYKCGAPKKSKSVASEEGDDADEPAPPDPRGLDGPTFRWKMKVFYHEFGACALESDLEVDVSCSLGKTSIDPGFSFTTITIEDEEDSEHICNSDDPIMTTPGLTDAVEAEAARILVEVKNIGFDAASVRATLPQNLSPLIESSAEYLSMASGLSEHGILGPKNSPLTSLPSVPFLGADPSVKIVVEKDGFNLHLISDSPTNTLNFRTDKIVVQRFTSDLTPGLTLEEFTAIQKHGARSMGDALVNVLITATLLNAEGVPQTREIKRLMLNPLDFMTGSAQ